MPVNVRVVEVVTCCQVVGHSVGAGVALFVALRRPDLVRHLILISGAFHHTGELGSGDEIDVDPVVAAFGASYGEVSPDGKDHYPVIVRKIFELGARFRGRRRKAHQRRGGR